MEKTVFYADLRRRILAYYNTMADFANAINLSATSLSNKLNNKTPWRLDEITTVCTLLNIPKTEVPFYFLNNL